MSEILNGYDRWSTSYDRHDNPMVDATTWALDARPFACRDADVLELGCGTGRHVARVLADGARSYAGLDGSAGMLAVARARAGDDPRVRFVEADLFAPLPFADATFDRALVVLVLEHVEHLAPVFGEIARVLRAGGRLRIVDIHASLVATGTAAHFRDADGEVHFASFAHPTATIVETLARAGLAPAALFEHVADGALVERVPKLAKHRGRHVLVDLDLAIVHSRP